MIVTVTLNPSLDHTVEIERLLRGEVIRAARSQVDPGGKGVNVSRALLANGVASRAVLPYGGDGGQQLVRLLRAEGSTRSRSRSPARPAPTSPSPSRTGPLRRSTSRVRC